MSRTKNMWNTPNETPVFGATYARRPTAFRLDLNWDIVRKWGARYGVAVGDYRTINGEGMYELDFSNSCLRFYNGEIFCGDEHVGSWYPDDASDKREFNLPEELVSVVIVDIFSALVA